MHCYIFDIDGTLSDLSHRLPHIQKEPKDWDAFFNACCDDAPIRHICELAGSLDLEVWPVVFVSGRSDRVRNETKEWLQKHVGCYEHLYMRRHGDHRPDHQVKRDLLEQLRADGFEPIMAFDDRDQVVKMWRELGIPCAQVADGNF